MEMKIGGHPWMCACASCVGDRRQRRDDGVQNGKFDPELEWEFFWKRLVTNTNGELDLNKIKNELCDFSMILHEVPKVYCYVTGGRVSKINTHASAVIQQADQYTEECFRVYESETSYLRVATFLYSLLDDIDTASDIAKSNDELYRKLVEKIQSMKKHAVAECDGYNLVLKTDAVFERPETPLDCFGYEMTHNIQDK